MVFRGSVCISNSIKLLSYRLTDWRVDCWFHYIFNVVWFSACIQLDIFCLVPSSLPIILVVYFVQFFCARCVYKFINNIFFQFLQYVRVNICVKKRFMLWNNIAARGRFKYAIFFFTRNGFFKINLKFLKFRGKCRSK